MSRISKLLTVAFLFCALPAQAQSVQQSGVITPGHAACWAITGVIYDCGSPGGGVSVVGSTTTNDFVAFNASGSLIDSGINPANTSNISGLWNFNGGATAPTRPALDSSTNVATTAFVTGGVANIFTSPQTVTALWTFNGGIAGSGPINMLNTTTPANLVTTPGYSFNDNGIVGGNFSDAFTHIAFNIGGNSPLTGNGSYAGLNVTQFGAGRGVFAFVTGAVFQATAVSGNGNYSGGNPYVVICGTAVVAGQCPFGTAATVQSAVGMEVDIFSNAGATMLYKEGLRIADLGVIQASGANNLSAGIAFARATTSPGFVYGLYFGDPSIGDNLFPLAAGGSAMKFGPTTHIIDSIIDASSLTSGITTAALILPDGLPAIKWASVRLLETSSLVAFQFGAVNAALFEPSISTFSGTLFSGNPGTNAGALQLAGLTTGAVVIQLGAANAGTFNFNLPVTAGAAGQVLTSQAGGSTAMTWTTVGQIIPISSNGAVAQNSTVFEVSAQSATEGVASAVCPRAGTFKNLYVNTGAIGGSVQTVTATLRVNSGSSTITCQIATASTTCNDTTHTAACTVGQLYSLQVVTSATTGSVSFVNGGVEFDPN